MERRLRGPLGRQPPPQGSRPRSRPSHATWTILVQLRTRGASFTGFCLFIVQTTTNSAITCRCGRTQFALLESKRFCTFRACNLTPAAALYSAERHRRQRLIPSSGIRFGSFPFKETPGSFLASAFSPHRKLDRTGSFPFKETPGNFFASAFSPHRELGPVRSLLKKHPEASSPAPYPSSGIRFGSFPFKETPGSFLASTLPLIGNWVRAQPG